jgi:hypothetical protein
MTRAKKRKQHQGCDVGKMIDTIEKAASVAMKMCKAVEPIIKVILTNGRKTK